VLIGADCPGLDASRLREAASMLRSHDAVFVPAEDGGYALIGLASAWPRLFEAIEWGTATVMDRTRAIVRELGLRCVELAPAWDVDRPEDFDRLCAEGLCEGVPQ
jgi:glycosyltransferase A (GT-A) superfamily protein (DUF2064 family)